MGNVNHFAVVVLAVLIYLAAAGWLKIWCTRRGGSSFERLIASCIAFVWSGFFLFLLFVTNLVLATTGIERSWGSEALDRVRGFLISTLFHGSGFRSNELLAIIFVGASFIAAGLLLKAIGDLATAFNDGTWRQGWTVLGTLILRLTIAATFAFIFLYTDTTMLLFRTVTMMYPDELATVPSDLPSVATIIASHQGTQGAVLLQILAVAYPAAILLFEKHAASNAARLVEAARQHFAARAQAGGRTPQVTPPAIAPVVPAPRQHQGNGDGDGPGGAARHIRPIPFNPGPQN